MKRLVMAVAVLCTFLGRTVLAQVRGDAANLNPPSDSIKVSFEHEGFMDDTEAWTFLYAEYAHKASFGSFLVRVSEGGRFGTEGMQYEVDAYPRLGKGTYAYLNFGVSGSSLFPEYRYGAQIYRSLPKSFEASIGARYLDFESSNVVIWTGSIGKYKGNYFTWFQPYVVNGDDGLSATGVLQVRRYFATGDEYMTVRASYGNAPDVDTLLQVTTKLDNWSLGVDRQWALNKSTFFLGAIGFRDREYSARLERESIYFELSFKHRF